jgi:transposase-like protein
MDGQERFRAPVTPDQGIRSLLLGISRGPEAPGLIRAVEKRFPSSLRQRCLVHRMRKIAAKLAEDVRAAFKAATCAACAALSLDMAHVLRDDLVTKYKRRSPTAVACVLEDFNACVENLRCLPGHLTPREAPICSNAPSSKSAAG